MARWLLVLMVFVPVLSNALISQAVPTALLAAYDNDRVRTARMLGRLSSCGALLDVLLTPQLGRLSDTLGRRPLILVAPCMALMLRAAAASRPATALLMALRVLGTTLTSTYLVCLRASLADAHRFEGTGKLTGRLGLMQASNGAAYALGMLLGGQLVARHIRLPYVASATLLALLVPVVFLCFRETLGQAQRVRFSPRPPGLGFVRLFSSGPELRGLSAVHALQTLSVAMGDTWQVFSRELRGWGASECGLFGSLSGRRRRSHTLPRGLSPGTPPRQPAWWPQGRGPPPRSPEHSVSAKLEACSPPRAAQGLRTSPSSATRLGAMVAALLSRRSVRTLGTRGHTLLATGSVVLTDLALATGSSSMAFAALAPNWVGRTQGMAVSARTMQVGAALGMGQGALAGDRQNLHSMLKVIGPTLYGYLFAYGCQIGVPALPFLFAAATALVTELLVLVSPRLLWKGLPKPRASATHDGDPPTKTK